MSGRWFASFGENAGKVILAEMNRYSPLDWERRAVIQQAIRDGLSVSEDVLADYPDLVTHPPTQRLTG